MKIGYKKYTHCKSVGICAKISLVVDCFSTGATLLMNSYRSPVSVGSTGRILFYKHSCKVGVFLSHSTLSLNRHLGKEISDINLCKNKKHLNIAVINQD
mgnify:CR=1 FL=1